MKLRASNPIHTQTGMTRSKTFQNGNVNRSFEKSFFLIALALRKPAWLKDSNSVWLIRVLVYKSKRLRRRTRPNDRARSPRSSVALLRLRVRLWDSFGDTASPDPSRQSVAPLWALYTRLRGVLRTSLLGNVFSPTPGKPGLWDTGKSRKANNAFLARLNHAMGTKNVPIALKSDLRFSLW